MTWIYHHGIRLGIFSDLNISVIYSAFNCPKKIFLLISQFLATLEIFCEGRFIPECSYTLGPLPMVHEHTSGLSSHNRLAV